jgi:hypothetical protein
VDKRTEAERVQYELLRLDDYAVPEQDRQRLRLIEDLRDEKLLDPLPRKMLETQEALEGGWLRPIVWGYHEGLFGLSDAAAEISALVDHLVRQGKGD